MSELREQTRRNRSRGRRPPTPAATQDTAQLPLSPETVVDEHGHPITIPAEPAVFADYDHGDQ